MSVDAWMANNVVFYDVTKKKTLKTFNTKTSTIKVKDQKFAIRADRETISKFLSIQQLRNLNLSEVMQYELGALPLPLAICDSTLLKRIKLKPFKHLESTILEINRIPDRCSRIFGGMVLLQKLGIRP